MKRFALIIAVLTITACASMNVATPIARYVTLDYISTDTGVDVEKAQRVHDHAVAVKAYLESDTLVSVAQLEKYIVDRVDWSKLSLADTVLAQEFIHYFAVEMQSRTEEASHPVVASDLIDVVIRTVDLYI